MAINLVKRKIAEMRIRKAVRSGVPPLVAMAMYQFREPGMGTDCHMWWKEGFGGNLDKVQDAHNGD